jgi:hypothetical protein
MYLLFGATYYASFAAHRLKGVLYTGGYGVPPVGGSSAAGSLFVQFRKGDRYKDLKAENDKIAGLNVDSSASYMATMNRFRNDPWFHRNVFKDKEVRAELKKDEKSENVEFSSMNAEERFLVKKEIGKGKKQVSPEQRVDIGYRYIDEFMQNRGDKDYMERMLQMIDGTVKSAKPGKIQNKQGVINDL